MVDDLSLYLMLVAALAIGFVLGRRDGARGRGKNPLAALPTNEYFHGINHLASDHPDLAVDSVLESLLASNDDVAARLALGALVRRRGETDKAIRIHQGLLARPSLSPTESSRIELELARDYLSAGLLGRAENLLLELARRNGPETFPAQRGLLEIYQREREWRQAVVVGRQVARRDPSVRVRLAHFQCELAELALAQGDLRQARKELARGADLESGCARVNLVGAAVEAAARRPQHARRRLLKAVAQDPYCVPLTVAPFKAACNAMDDPSGYVAFLEDCLRRGPFLLVVQELADQLEQVHGAAAAADFVEAQLVINPTLGGFVTLLGYLDRDGRPLGGEQLGQVRRFSESLLEKQALYRCGSCGFSSHSPMWQCPGCHEWDRARPVLRVERVT